MTRSWTIWVNRLKQDDYNLSAAELINRCKAGVWWTGKHHWENKKKDWKCPMITWEQNEKDRKCLKTNSKTQIYDKIMYSHLLKLSKALCFLGYSSNLKYIFLIHYLLSLTYKIKARNTLFFYCFAHIMLLSLVQQCWCCLNKEADNILSFLHHFNGCCSVQYDFE